MITLIAFSLLFCQTAAITEDGKELLLVHTLWRHGDRSPTDTYKTDYYQEDFWDFGGSGFGQLSPEGMRQHVDLGRMLRDRYIDGQYKGYLSNYYDSHEVYYRSTDRNRTVISALSNILGMWSQPDYNNRVGQDFPNNTLWPAGFVPIPIHTVDYSIDFVGNAKAPCDRSTKLWSMAQNSPEMQSFNQNVSGLFALLAEKCGQPIDLDNLWIISDAYFIENIYAKDMHEKNSWYTEELYAQVDSANDQAILYQNGIFNEPIIMNNLNIGKEIQKIKGGSLVNEMDMHLNMKMDCLRRNQTGSECKWISRLKYYVYSAHDATIYAFLSAFGIQSAVVTPRGYPRYSAALLLELWYDRKADIPYFKMLYHDGDGVPFHSVTETIPECNNQTFCPLSVYNKYSVDVKPDQPMPQWCQVDPTIVKKSAGALLTGFRGVEGAVGTHKLSIYRMADFAVGDLYDHAASKHSSTALEENASYCCRFCPDFEVTGKELISSNAGRAHAAAHRISFDALLDPNPGLLCPICEESIASGSVEAVVISDLELVRHLVECHDDLLSDELVGDFAEPSYTLTSFQKSAGTSEETSSEENTMDSEVDGEEAGPCSSAAVSTDMSTSNLVPMSFSRITCSLCPWSASRASNIHKLKQKLISHVRSHIRLKLAENPIFSDPLATERLCCIDFILEEYSESGELDLSNAHCTGLASTYRTVLTEIFGLCLPLAMRIIHGVDGNPFKSLPESEPEVIECYDSSSSGNDSPEDTTLPQEDSLFIVPTVYRVPEVIVQCRRTECGHMGIGLSDTGAFIRHLAAHIRHDEKRLQMVATPLICECGLASYSPQGFVYHEFRDHCFTKKTYNGFGQSIVAYIILVWDSLIRTCAGSDNVIHTLLDGPWSRTNMRSLVPIWGAYLCLEPDEGEEAMFSNNSTVSDLWLKKWKMLAGKDQTPTAQDIDAICEISRRPYRRLHSVHADLIHLLETHPFVPYLKPPRVRRKLYCAFDEKSLLRVFNVSWKQLNTWLARSDEERKGMAPVSRWNQLYDIRRRINYKKNKTLIKADGVRNIHWEDKDLAPFQCIPGLISRQSDYVAPQFYISGREQIEINGRPDRERSSEVEVKHSSSAVEEKPIKVEVEEEEEAVDDGQKECDGTELSNADTIQEQEYKPTNFLYLPPNPSLKGQYMACLYCENYLIEADDTQKVTTHCASHAILESRQLSNLYIHLQSERPLTCPFCHKEHPFYSPIDFMQHVEDEHEAAALWIYEKLLKRELPPSMFMSDASKERPLNTVQNPEVFVIRCGRSSICGTEEILRMEKHSIVNGCEVDNIILSHLLWHVKNDDEVKIGKNEMDLVCRVLSSRLQSLSPTASNRLIPIMTRKAIRHWPRLNRKEPDVIRFVMEVFHELTSTLFGSAKGFVFSMVFPRRWHRDQCGLFLYPVCQCLLCADIHLSKYSNDRRKRIFLNNVRPVLQHVIEHLEDGLVKISNECDAACPLDGNSFHLVSEVIQHILSAHKDVIELNGFRMLISDMGILTIFDDALKQMFGSQAWQLKEALGFDVFVKIKADRPTFFEEMESDYNFLLRDHRADCVRFRDAFAKHCHCGDLISSSAAIINKNQPNGLPLEVLPFYKEFLKEEPKEEVPNDSIDTTTATDSPPEVKIEPPDEVEEEMPPVVHPCTTGNVVDILNTLMCANILASSLGTQPLLFDPTLDIPTDTPINAEDLLMGPKKKPRQKRKSASEEKATTKPAVVRNSQLPLKNVIQGSRTVAAAVAAALGTTEETTTTEQASPAAFTKTLNSASSSSVVTSSVLGKRESTSLCVEESDLALGSMAKRVRQPSTSDTPRKKQRSRRRKPTSISALLLSEELS